jgi:hypothetical protein
MDDERVVYLANAFNKKLSDLLGKMDEKVLQAKMNAAIDMLQKGNTEELAKKINKMDQDELLSKINDLDKSKLNDLAINLEDIKNKVSDDDLKKLSSLMGKNGDEIVSKLNKLLK